MKCARRFELSVLLTIGGTWEVYAAQAARITQRQGNDNVLGYYNRYSH